MKTAYQKLAALCKAANISKTELATTLGYKSQQSMSRAVAKEKVCRNTLIMVLKLCSNIDTMEWTICPNCSEPLQNSEIKENTCPSCNAENI